MNVWISFQVCSSMELCSFIIVVVWLTGGAGELLL